MKKLILMGIISLMASSANAEILARCYSKHVFSTPKGRPADFVYLTAETSGTLAIRKVNFALINDLSPAESYMFGDFTLSYLYRMPITIIAGKKQNEFSLEFKGPNEKAVLKIGDESTVLKCKERHY